ncbi:hypothetical protein J6590_090756, partial [Homalodisca vitripennis]
MHGYLYKNKIREVESKVFQGLSKLEQLYLHFNKIDKLHPNTFADLATLERLFLHNNKLRHLSSGTFKGLDSLKRIRLDSNVLVCDCEMMWLAHLLRDKQESTQAAAPTTGQQCAGLRLRDDVAGTPAEGQAGEYPGRCACQLPTNIGTTGQQCAGLRLRDDVAGTPAEGQAGQYPGRRHLSVPHQHRSTLTVMCGVDDDTCGLRLEMMGCTPAEGQAGNDWTAMAGLRLRDDVAGTPAEGQAGVPRPLLSVTPNIGTTGQQCAGLRLRDDVAGTPAEGQAGEYPGRCACQRLDSNALVCDCEMMWLAHLLRDKQDSTQAAATCQFPTNMEGKPLVNISDNDFHCSKPRLTEEPRDVEVSFGGTVFFTCKAEGDPQPKIVWMRDSNEINTDDPRYSVSEDGTLRIAPMSDADIGVYECMAKSPTGEVKSRSAKMIYNKRNSKPHFFRTPHDVSADIGETVRLDCAASGLPTPDILWTRDDLPVRTGGKFQITDPGTLTITGIEREDAGAYKCSAANFVGRISTVVQVRVNVAPQFVTSPENLTVRSGYKAELRCEADGSPEPVITWFKDGKTVVPGGRLSISSEGTLLTIEHVKESDSGLYTCLAQNQVGSAESSGEIRVRGYGPRPPRLVLQPYPITAPVGTSVELPCKAEGEPIPTITWTKDNVALREDRNHRVFPIGSLRLYNLTVDDGGLYECIATNQYGEVTARGSLIVEDLTRGRAPGDRYVHLAFQEASAAVDRAINATIASLFTSRNGTNRTPSYLMRLMRFPDASTRNIIRAAEIYERTLINIRKHIQSGLKVNLTQDYSYSDILSPQQLQLVANLSGCMEHQAPVNCSDMCFHSKYRTIDGTCNNLQHPRRGASLTGFRRILKPIYENGFSTPI